MATFTSNIPVIFVTFRSHRFEDSAAKLIASLGASDIVNMVMISCCAGMVTPARGAEVTLVDVWLLRLLETGVYIFDVCSVSHFGCSVCRQVYRYCSNSHPLYHLQ